MRGDRRIEIVVEEEIEEIVEIEPVASEARDVVSPSYDFVY